MKCLAEAEMEDYISPPPYLENHPSNDLLITRLKSRIDTDLYRINSVYDMEITESENKKALVILQLKEEHSSIINIINKKREKEVEKYIKNAEICFDNLISPPPEIVGWGETYFRWFLTIFTPGVKQSPLV